MIDPIKWETPELIEAFNMRTGEHRDVQACLVKAWPDSVGDYWLQSLGAWFRADGSPLYGGNWIIRNKPEAKPAYPPELVERMRELVRRMAHDYYGLPQLDVHEATAILAELEPADPIDEILRKAGVCRGIRKDVVPKIRKLVGDED